MTTNTRAMEHLNVMMNNANQDEPSRLRMKGWDKAIQWNVGNESFFWKIQDGKLSFVNPTETDFIVPFGEWEKNPRLSGEDFSRPAGPES